VFSCDYNGWADVPEAEREGLEAFEAASTEVVSAVSPGQTEPALSQPLPGRWADIDWKVRTTRRAA
jgi:hypothetical protein